MYRYTSNIKRTIAGNKLVDHLDVVGASPDGVAPTTSSFSTERLASTDWAKTTAGRHEYRDMVRLLLKILRLSYFVCGCNVAWKHSLLSMRILWVIIRSCLKYNGDSVNVVSEYSHVFWHKYQRTILWRNIYNTILQLRIYKLSSTVL